MESYEIDHLKDLLVNGLINDAGHHKQWYLEQVLLFIVGKPEFEELQQKEEWEKGIAP
jgi:hypothetical protein